MRKTHYEFCRFELTEPEAIEAHLAEMAAQGWQLDQIGVQLWRYRAAEPQALRYAVAYSMDAPATVLEAEPTEAQLEYRAYCEAAGWHFETGLAQMEIYSTADPDAPPLETDEALKLAGIRRVMRRKYLPYQLGLLVFSGLVLGLVCRNFLRTPVLYLDSCLELALLPLFPVVFLDTLAQVMRYWLWSRRSGRSVAMGGGCVRQTSRFRRARMGVLWAILLLSAVGLAADVCTVDPGKRAVLLYKAAGYVLLYGAAHIAVTLQRRRKWNRDSFFGWYLVIAVVAAWFFTFNTPDTSEINRVDRAQLPLSAEDLGWPLSGQSRPYISLEYSWSPLLQRLEGHDLNGMYRLNYTRYRSPWPYLLRAIAEDLHDVPAWTQLPPDPAWRGGEVWYRDGFEGAAVYCAVYPGVVLYLDYDIPPTPEQIGISLDALLP